MSNKPLKPVASAIGAAIAGSMILAGAAGAAENPFGMTELNSGYMQLAGAEGKCGGNMADKANTKAMGKRPDGKCGTGKCGANMKPKMKGGKCGGNMQAKPMEGKCGGNMANKASTAAMAKKPNGKCGTGKCGANRKAKMTGGNMQAKPMEGKCGGMKK